MEQVPKPPVETQAAVPPDDAFAAGQWLIDTIKQVVPIWKQENWTDGASEWVHPGMNDPAPSTNVQ